MKTSWDFFPSAVSAVFPWDHALRTEIQGSEHGKAHERKTSGQHQPPFYT